MVTPSDLAGLCQIPLATVYRWNDTRAGPPSSGSAATPDTDVTMWSGGSTNDASKVGPPEPLTADERPLTIRATGRSRAETTGGSGAMAHVEDRWKRSDGDRKGGGRRGRRWRARYRGPDGRERAKSFQRKVEAERWLAKVEVDKARGQWVDARLGRTTVRELAERTEAGRVNRRPSTKARDASLLRSRVFPSFGDWAVADVTSADVRAWVAELDAAGLAPTTVRKCYQLLARTFEDAVGDGILAVSPCRNVRLPKDERSEPVLLTPGVTSDARQRGLNPR